MEVAQAARQGGRIIQIASTERDRARDSMFGEGLSGRVCGCFYLFVFSRTFFSPLQMGETFRHCVINCMGSSKIASVDSRLWQLLGGYMLGQGNFSSPLRHQACFLGKPYWWRN